MAMPAIDRPQRTARSEASRKQLAAAAIDVFGTYGYAKATIQEIVTRAHVSKPLFYRHFRNKEEIFGWAVDRVFSDWREALERAAEGEPDSALAALRAVFMEQLDYARARPFLNRLLSRDSQWILSTRTEVWDEACDALRKLIEQLLDRGVAEGEVRTDLPVDHLADLLTEIHLAYANRQILTGRLVDARLAENVAACMISGVESRSGER